MVSDSTEITLRTWTNNDLVILVRAAMKTGVKDENKLDSSKAELGIDRLRRALMSG